MQQNGAHVGIVHRTPSRQRHRLRADSPPVWPADRSPCTCAPSIGPPSRPEWSPLPPRMPRRVHAAARTEFARVLDHAVARAEFDGEVALGIRIAFAVRRAVAHGLDDHRIGRRGAVLHHHAAADKDRLRDAGRRRRGWIGVVVVGGRSRGAPRLVRPWCPVWCRSAYPCRYSAAPSSRLWPGPMTAVGISKPTAPAAVIALTQIFEAIPPPLTALIIPPKSGAGC